MTRARVVLLAAEGVANTCSRRAGLAVAPVAWVDTADQFFAGAIEKIEGDSDARR